MSLLSGNLIRFGAQIDNRVSRELGRMRGDFDKVSQGRGFQSIVQGVGLGVGLQAWNMLGGGVSSVIGTIQSSIDAASNMNETLTKSEAVFGDAAKEMEAWGETSATAMGQSKRLALESAASFGNLFKSMGVTNTESVTMSKNLVQLASDLASFNNQNPEEVLQSLRSGLVGEVEPLRRFGIALNSATVENKALEMGLAATRKELTESDKVQARYAIVLEQTATAQGDYARTADGLANIQRTQAAQWEDLQAELGEKFLPIVVEISKVMRDNMVPVMQTLIANLNQLIPVVGLLAAVFATRLVPVIAGPLRAAILAANIALATMQMQVGATAKASTALRASLGVAAAGIKGFAGALRAIAVPGALFLILEGLVQIQNMLGNVQAAGEDMKESVEKAMGSIDVSSATSRAQFEQMVAVLERGRAQLDAIGEGSFGRWFYGVDAQIAEIDRQLAAMHMRAQLLADADFSGTWDEYIAATEEAARAVEQVMVTAAGFTIPIPDSQAIAKPWTETGQLVVKTVGDKLLQMSTIARKAAQDLRDGFKEGLRSGWGQVESALDELLERLGARLKPDSPAAKRFEKFAEAAMENLKKPMTGAQRTALLREYLDTGTSAGAALEAGLTDADPLLREAARELREAIITELAKLGVYLEDEGMAGGQMFGDGIKSSQEFILTKTGEIVAATTAKLGELAPGAKTEGGDAGKGFGQGIKDQQAWILTKTGEVVNATTNAMDRSGSAATSGRNVARAWLNALAAYLRKYGPDAVMQAAEAALLGIKGMSPPRVGPLRDIGKWGGNVARAWVDAFSAGITGMPVLAVPQPVLAGAGVMGMGGGGGAVSQTITINVDGARYGSPDELGAAIAGHLRSASVWR